jgi:hypothetical protein
MKRGGNVIRSLINLRLLEVLGRISNSACQEKANKAAKKVNLAVMALTENLGDLAQLDPVRRSDLEQKVLHELDNFSRGIWAEIAGER